MGLTAAGLGGADWMVPMPKERLGAAASLLASCHDHNFAVIGGGSRLGHGMSGIMCSELAKDCLEAGGLTNSATSDETT